MSVTNLYVLIAREVITDATDNMTSIIKIIEKFTFGVNQAELEKNNIRLGKQQISLPAEHSIATSWLFDEKTKKDIFLTFKIRLIDPSGNILSSQEQENMLPPSINKANMNLNMQGITVTGEGEYTLRAELFSKAGKLLAYGEYPFLVEFTHNSA